MTVRLPRRTNKEVDGLYLDQLVRKLEDTLTEHEARIDALNKKEAKNA